jgi:integrase
VKSKKSEKLTAKKVAKLVRRGVRGKHHDGHGLYLQIQNRDNASWFLRYERDGKEHFPGLGPAHIVGLKLARERAQALRLQLLNGVDPIAAKKAAKAQRALDAAKAMSFSEAARGYIEQHGPKWRNARHAAQWPSSLAEYVEPIIGALPVREIDITLVLKVLEQKVPARRGSPAGSLWLTRPETARRLRGRLESIFDFAKARGYRSGENPAAWSIISNVLPAPSKLTRVENHPALPYAQIPEFLAKLRTRSGNAARALEFTILCAARSGETIGARWGEIDLDAVRIDPKTKQKIADPVWTVPAVRMKTNKEHRVPLSDRAVEILKAIPREAGNDLIFIGPTRAGLSHAAKINLIRRLGYPDVTVHGFRSAFRDWAGETTAFASDVCEAALAHIKGKTERAYQRGDLFNKRRRLMDAWAEYCASLPSKTTADVVPIGIATGASHGKA